MFTTAENCMEKRKLSYKNRFFSLVGNYLHSSNNSRQLIFNIDSDNLLRFTKRVKCLPEF